MSPEHFLSRFNRRPIRFTILGKGLLLVTVPLVFQLFMIGLIHKLSREEQVANQWFVHTKLWNDRRSSF